MNPDQLRKMAMVVCTVGTLELAKQNPGILSETTILQSLHNAGVTALEMLPLISDYSGDVRAWLSAIEQHNSRN